MHRRRPGATNPRIPSSTAATTPAPSRSRSGARPRAWCDPRDGSRKASPPITSASARQKPHSRSLGRPWPEAPTPPSAARFTRTPTVDAGGHMALVRRHMPATCTQLPAARAAGRRDPAAVRRVRRPGRDHLPRGRAGCRSRSRRRRRPGRTTARSHGGLLEPEPSSGVRSNRFAGRAPTRQCQREEARRSRAPLIVLRRAARCPKIGATFRSQKSRNAKTMIVNAKPR